MEHARRSFGRREERTGRRLAVDLKLLAEFVEPCPKCGAACSGTLLFYYASDGRRWAVAVDRPSFEALLRRLSPVPREMILPAFLRQWLEGSGWCAPGAPIGGTRLSTDDLEAALELLYDAACTRTEARLVGALRGLLTAAGHAERPVHVIAG